METIIEILTFILFGFAGIGIMTLFRKSDIQKHNEETLKKVEKKSKENEELTNKINQNLKNVNNEIDKLEKEKNDKPKSDKELADWFNNRKSK